MQPLLYALYTAVLFVVFLVTTFPHELVVRRLLDNAATGNLVIEVNGVRPGWGLAYTFDELRLIAAGSDQTPVLTAAGVRVAPSLLGLLRGRPYPLAIRAHLYDGTLAATVDPRAATFDLHAAFQNIDVARHPGLRLLVEGNLRGLLGGTVDVRGDSRRPTTMNGNLEVHAAGLAIESARVRGIALPALHFSQVRIAGNVRSGRIELSDTTATGQELSLGGSGSVLLQHPLDASLMNLALTIRPAADLPAALRLALNLIPGQPDADGARTFRLTGSFAQPSLQPAGG